MEDTAPHLIKEDRVGQKGSIFLTQVFLSLPQTALLISPPGRCGATHTHYTHTHTCGCVFAFSPCSLAITWCPLHTSQRESYLCVRQGPGTEMRQMPQPCHPTLPSLATGLSPPRMSLSAVFLQKKNSYSSTSDFLKNQNSKFVSDRVLSSYTRAMANMRICRSDRRNPNATT